MAAAVIYDAVTLFHFAVVDRLDILECRHAHRPLPRWCEAVHYEVATAAAHGVPGAHLILDAAWLGDPKAPTAADLPEVAMVHVGLNLGRRPPVDHAGEAESIYFADKLGAVFATDDNEAYDQAARRLGPAQVIDSVAILAEAVSMDELSRQDAASVANAILDGERYFRRVHPTHFDPSDFG